MDWLISAEARDARRLRVLRGLSTLQMQRVVEAADKFAVAGLCGDPQREELHALLWELRDVGLADS